MGHHYLEGLIEELAAEAAPHGYADSDREPEGRIFRIGRQGPAQAHEMGHPADEHLALVPVEEELLGPIEAEPLVSEPQSPSGLTGSYSSRLFGASSGYFAEKILRK